MSLTKAQAKAASILRQERPTVWPGTNVIISDQERTVWNNKVIRAMKEHKVFDPPVIKEFCDLAGVPD